MTLLTREPVKMLPDERFNTKPKNDPTEKVIEKHSEKEESATKHHDQVSTAGIAKLQDQVGTAAAILFPRQPI